MTADTFFFTIAPFFIVLSIMILALFLVVLQFFKHLDKSGGFSILAEQWPARLEPSGTVFSHQTLGLGKIWYKNCVKVVSSDGGLYISVGFPFRRGTLFCSDSGKSALIPWGSIRFRQKKSAFWTDMYEYEVQSQKPVILTVPKQIAYSFSEYVKPPV
jgi:hypothetical protein